MLQIISQLDHIFQYSVSLYVLIHFQGQSISSSFFLLLFFFLWGEGEGGRVRSVLGYSIPVMRKLTMQFSVQDLFNLVYALVDVMSNAFVIYSSSEYANKFWQNSFNLRHGFDYWFWVSVEFVEFKFACNSVICQLYFENYRLWELSLVTRKPVFGVSDQIRHKPACAATEASYSLEISDIETRDDILSGQRKLKVLIRLRGCADWSAPLLFAYG